MREDDVKFIGKLSLNYLFLLITINLEKVVFFPFQSSFSVVSMQRCHSVNLFLCLQDIQEANFKTSSSRLLAAVMSALCHTSVKLTSIFPIAYDGEALLRSMVKQVSTENDSALAHRFPLLVAHMEKLSQVRMYAKNLMIYFILQQKAVMYLQVFA